MTDSEAPDVDPFGTSALRESVLASWRSSPTRLREDATTEADLVAGGYRDRVVTELAQNAADAAVRAGVPGRMAVWVDGDAVHVANVGAPLDRSGVHALAALRSSSKSDGSVGRYGVGFTAVRTVSDRVEVRSTSGSVVFDAARTRAELAAEVGAPHGVPVLRLPWPTDVAPSAGWDTEIVLHDVADPADVTAAAARDAVDLLLELPGLTSITVQDSVIERRTSSGPGAWDDVRIGAGRWWHGETDTASWYLPLSDGAPAPVSRDVLRAPTGSDEALSIPLIVVAQVPLQPDRRRILPGTDVAPVAAGYGDLVASLPESTRALTVPRPGLAVSDVDHVLRTALLEDLSRSAWVPTAAGPPLRPADAVVLESISTELTDLLADVVPGLVAAESSDRAGATALVTAGARRVGLAGVVDALSGVSRPPAWWRRMYDALSEMVHDSADLDECAALPVPLTDGRTVTGPRTVLTLDGPAVGPVRWARVAHPDAVHPLLARLGAQTARPVDLLTDPALAALLDDPDGVSDDLVRDVLTLASTLDPDIPHGVVGSLPLPSTDGELRAADELLLPGSPLSRVLYADSPFGVVDQSTVDEFGADALRVVGVGWSFGVVTDGAPAGPDHDLDDEDAWWRSVPGEPAAVIGVRDLDLVDPARWSDALTLLADDPNTAAALRDRSGYTAWWLRRHAVLDDTPLGLLRAPEDPTFEGLLDPANHPRAAEFAAALAASDIDDTDTAADVLAAASESERQVSPGVAIRLYRALADAVGAGRVNVADIDPPELVRTLAGTVADPAAVVVIDHSRWIAVVPADHAVLGSIEGADAIADLLDLPTASSESHVDVVSAGIRTRVDGHPALAAWSALSPWAIPGDVVLHDVLTVRCRGPVWGEGGVEQDVLVWTTDDGVVHVSRKVLP